MVEYAEKRLPEFRSAFDKLTRCAEEMTLVYEDIFASVVRDPITLTPRPIEVVLKTSNSSANKVVFFQYSNIENNSLSLSSILLHSPA